MPPRAYLYGRGVGRVAHEIWGPSAPPSHVSLFSTIGFAPDDDADLAQFWGLRSNVAVIGNAAISVRLPDLQCLGSRGERTSVYRAAGPLELPDRSTAEITARERAPFACSGGA